jgi:pimeloyl-ACP methyl ester carboxylesterase
VHLITYDHPGYGLSDPGRFVADAADAVKAIADGLGIAEFVVIGRAAATLAYAVSLPERVTRVASLVGLETSSTVLSLWRQHIGTATCWLLRVPWSGRVLDQIDDHPSTDRRSEAMTTVG